MSLVFSLRREEAFIVQGPGEPGRRFTIGNLFSSGAFTLKDDTGHAWFVSTHGPTDIMPEVKVSAGISESRSKSLARLVFTAPAHVAITREGI